MLDIHEYEANTKLFKFSLKSEGLIKQITNYLNNKTDRKFKEEMIKKVHKMNISPDEIVKILEQLNRNNLRKINSFILATGLFFLVLRFSIGLISIFQNLISNVIFIIIAIILTATIFNWKKSNSIPNKKFFRLFLTWLKNH